MVLIMASMSRAVMTGGEEEEGGKAGGRTKAKREACGTLRRTSEKHVQASGSSIVHADYK